MMPSGVEPRRIDIVLVRPARGANVAAACRAMKNMGVRRLRLVEPAADVSPEARRLAWGAWDVLDEAQRCPDLQTAVGAASFVVATSSSTRAGAWTPRQLAERAAARCGAGRLAIVFGPESHGLSRAEQQLCHERVRVPSDPAQPSLNLAQAVLLIAYELRLAPRSAALGRPEEARTPAPARELERALGALRRGLLGVGYLNPQNPDAVLSELRSLLARARPSRREISLLRGIARQIEWAARQLPRRRAPSGG